MKSAYLNGLRTFAFESREALVEHLAKTEQSLVAVNATKIIRRGAVDQAFVNQNIGYADGVGAVWALWRAGFPGAVKIAGCELWLDIVKAFCSTKSFYLFGGKEPTIRAVVTKLKGEYPNINLVGFRDGFIEGGEAKDRLINDIVAKKPEVVFVAMGSPKQELLMDELRARHKAIYMGLGGSFDVYIGDVQRTPKWLIDCNLEWAYRILTQPRRILRQYVLVEFGLRLVFNKL